jgi:hypothetical protein
LLVEIIVSVVLAKVIIVRAVPSNAVVPVVLAKAVVVVVVARL